jgi:hypothetical protein
VRWETCHRGSYGLNRTRRKHLNSIKTLLGCGGHDNSADDVRLLFAASKAVPSSVWAQALDAVGPCLALTCVEASSHCPPVRVMLVRITTGFWCLGWQCCSRSYSARATRSGRHSPGTAQRERRQTRGRMHQPGPTAAGRLDATNRQQPVQSVLQAPYADRLHHLLWAAAELEAPRMNPQNVANMV